LGRKKLPVSNTDIFKVWIQEGLSAQKRNPFEIEPVLPGFDPTNELFYRKRCTIAIISQMITAMTVQVTGIDNMDVNIVYENGAHTIHFVCSSPKEGNLGFTTRSLG
jgi:hypothetical protein